MSTSSPENPPLDSVDVDDLDGACPTEPDHPADLTVNVEPDLPGARPIDPQVKKANDAFIIALIIVGTFSAVILLTLLITAGILWKTGDPDRIKVFTEAVTPVYKSLGEFAPPVFGSLLAFILGYYYSKEQNK